MKKICLILFAMLTCFNACPVFANVQDSDPQEEFLVYVEPEIARVMIIKHFSHMTTEFLPDWISEVDDISILRNVLDAYIVMLEETNGYVSVDGLRNICHTAFRDLVYKDKNCSMLVQMHLQIPLIERKCADFAKDLTSAQLEQNDECEYEITKVNGSQSNIKYVNRVYGTGFYRKNGGLPWRFFNPGALRDSPYKCALFRVIQDGKPGHFAVFDSEYRGRMAVRYLLENSSKYQTKTIREAIPLYAPQVENNPTKYIRDLARQGIDVNKVLYMLTDEEWDALVDAIATIEGWNAVGKTEEF